MHRHLSKVLGCRYSFIHSFIYSFSQRNPKDNNKILTINISYNFTVQMHIVVKHCIKRRVGSHLYGWRISRPKVKGRPITRSFTCRHGRCIERYSPRISVSGAHFVKIGNILKTVYLVDRLWRWYFSMLAIVTDFSMLAIVTDFGGCILRYGCKTKTCDLL